MRILPFLSVACLPLLLSACAFGLAEEAAPGSSGADAPFDLRDPPGQGLPRAQPDPGAPWGEGDTAEDTVGDTGSSAGGSALAGLSFYVDPDSNAALLAEEWRLDHADDAAMMDRIAGQPVAMWLGGWNSDVAADTDARASAAAATGTVPIFVLYDVPQRDCGGYSAGGGDPDSYRAWIDEVARGLAGRPSVIVLEPDSLALITCLSSSELQDRYDLLRYATRTLKAAGDARVYLDAGNPAWIAAPEMAARLADAGVAEADGFAVNVSNFHTSADDIAYAETVAADLDGAHFIIDTSRNGLGAPADNEWCNPPDRALGNPPGTVTDSPLADAYLWVKAPGESDGSCNGGPSAGQWWPDYALGLAERANW